MTRLIHRAGKILPMAGGPAFAFKGETGKAAPRMRRNKLATALANKLARIAWGVLRTEKAFDAHLHEVTAI